MAEAELVDAGAAGGVAVDLDDGERVDQLLSVGLVRLNRQLEAVGGEGLVVEGILGHSEGPLGGA